MNNCALDGPLTQQRQGPTSARSNYQLQATNKLPPTPLASFLLWFMLLIPSDSVRVATAHVSNQNALRIPHFSLPICQHCPLYATTKSYYRSTNDQLLTDSDYLLTPIAEKRGPLVFLICGGGSCLRVLAPRFARRFACSPMTLAIIFIVSVWIECWHVICPCQSCIANGFLTSAIAYSPCGPGMF